MSEKENDFKSVKEHLDELFSEYGHLVKHEEQILCKPERKPSSLVHASHLKPFPGHPFHLYEGERLDGMVASIRANGVLVPISSCAGKPPGRRSLGIRDRDQPDAALLFRYGVFGKGSGYRDAASKLFSQGKRNDILRGLKC